MAGLGREGGGRGQGGGPELRLPPVVHGPGQVLPGPAPDLGAQHLAHARRQAEARGPGLPVAPQGPEHRGGGEEDVHPEVGQALVEGPGARVVGPVLHEEGGAAEEQGGVEAEGVAHDPEEVGGGVEHLSRLQVKDVSEGPGDPHHVPPVAVDHALGLPRGARGGKEEEGVGRGHGLGLGGPGLVKPLQKLGASPDVPEDLEVQALDCGLHHLPHPHGLAPVEVGVRRHEEPGPQVLGGAASGPPGPGPGAGPRAPPRSGRRPRRRGRPEARGQVEGHPVPPPHPEGPEEPGEPA